MLHVLYMGVTQALEVYHQDMLESGKYSSLNVVQLWDDLHHTLTSLTNKFIPSKLSSTRNNLPWVNQKKSNGLPDKETEFFRNIGNQVNLRIEKRPEAPIQKVHQTFLPILP